VKADPVQPPASLPVAGRRILVVEDEALVAILMRDVLCELGFAVVGPVATMAQALAAAREAPIDAAILDVNVGGEAIYPVADALAARGLPFVFVTGYSADAIERRYARVPVLEKPIQSDVLRTLFVTPLPEAPADAGLGPSMRLGPMEMAVSAQLS
jgi:CheY-like chemotaxis protein